MVTGALSGSPYLKVGPAAWGRQLAVELCCLMTPSSSGLWGGQDTRLSMLDLLGSRGLPLISSVVLCFHSTYKLIGWRTCRIEHPLSPNACPNDHNNDRASHS